MFRRIFNIVKGVLYIFILTFCVGTTCVFGYEEIFNAKPSLSYKSLRFCNDKIKLANLFFETTVNAGECKSVGSSSMYCIAYIDESDFMHPKLCMCQVYSCENLPVNQSEWGTKCETSIMCEKISSKPLPMVFCPLLLEEKNSIRFVPVEFSRQTFFKPGIRLIIVDNGSLYKRDFFLFENDVIGGDYKVAFSGKLYEFRIYRSGHNLICASYYDQGNFMTKCVPIPVLSKLKLSEHKNGTMEIRFYDVMTSEKGNLIDNRIMRDFNVDIVRPKIDVNSHDFYLYEQCQNGKILKLHEYCGNNEVSRVRYKHDNKITVKCVDGISAIFGYVLKSREKYEEYDKHTWLKPLPSGMVRYVRVHEKKYIQCVDYEYDITNKTQDFLDDLFINGDGYYFFPDEQYSNRITNIYPDDNPCNSLKNSYYLYQNAKLKLESSEFSNPEILTQFTKANRFDACVLRYFDVDHKKMLSLDTKLQSELQFLDYHSMGMCVDHFESKTYAVEKIAPHDNTLDSALLKFQEQLKNDKHVDVLLRYPKLTDVYNVPSRCDFVKVEIWSGGQSGKIDIENWKSEEGQPGEYVMGMFKTGKSNKYFIKVHLQGIRDQVFDNEHTVGTDAMIEFCKRDKYSHNGEVCEVKLTANGAGKLLNDMKKRIKSNKLVHDKKMLYYRVVNNYVTRHSENVPDGKRIRFIPYQDFMTEVLWEEIGKNECNSGKLLAENNSNYFGAGGCADVNTQSTEKGAGGIVKITCEDWYQ
ncbi:hypothetical protein ECHLIB_0132 [Ehrlichia chaffeensis str. Liberty]|uniref:hypothetical protein n=1 Tax=Ehrlichia chaffeensis TaxID=945 RepID=UPI000444EBCE|nr:hypothetical protein [Ehrlichia chaffeensis]AHX06213.1 hypothetical protein ECHLIB_0132 [Ehrlichia chaffeensis str. Liberty]AHX09569.1 hypothetical protein ECHWAK_0134 [Ehrlichia chaffeensis str. Wakulla]